MFTMKTLTEKQIYSCLDKYYKKVYGENYDDAWWINPAPNAWKFDRNGETITLICDIYTGKVTER